jgi:integrase
MAIEQVKLRTTIERFLASDKVLGFAPSTQRTYRRVLEILLSTIDDSQFNACQLRPRHVETCLRSLRDGASGSEEARRQRARLIPRSGRGDYTLNSDRAVLKRFMRFLHVHKYLSRGEDPMGLIENTPKPRPKVPANRMIMSRSQVKAYLDEAELHHPRDRMVGAIGAYAGLRESEIRELRIENVDLKAMTMTFWRDKPDDLHTVPIMRPLAAEFFHYFAWYELHYGPLEPTWFVCPQRSAQGGKLAIGTAMYPGWPMLPHMKVSGLTKDVVLILTRIGCGYMVKKGCHTLRRTFACMLLAATRDMRLVMRALGHKQIETTESYVMWSPETELLIEAMAGQDLFGMDEAPPRGAGNVVMLDSYRELDQFLDSQEGPAVA